MSRDKDPECRGLLLGETDNAINVCKDSESDDNYWIPRSQVGYMRKGKDSVGNDTIVFTCPEWLIEKKQCWELVP